MAQGKTLGRKPVGPRTEARVRELRGKGFAILEADAGGAQPMPIRVLGVMNPDVGNQKCQLALKPTVRGLKVVAYTSEPPNPNRMIVGGCRALLTKSATS
jgi:hypothetical protein